MWKCKVGELKTRLKHIKNKMVTIPFVAVLAAVAAILIWPDPSLDRYTLATGIAVAGAAYILCVYCQLLTYGPDEEDEPELATPPSKDLPHEETYVVEVERPRAVLSDLPVETIEGIGETYGKELRAAGIDTVEDLVAAFPEEIAKVCDVSQEQAEIWIAMGRFAWLEGVSEEDAEAIVFATGITGLSQLAKADPRELLKKINDAVEDGRVRVPEGYKFTIEKVERWIKSAKDVL